jgi:hypothetical protein
MRNRFGRCIIALNLTGGFEERSNCQSMWRGTGAVACASKLVTGEGQLCLDSQLMKLVLANGMHEQSRGDSTLDEARWLEDASC